MTAFEIVLLSAAVAAVLALFLWTRRDLSHTALRGKIVDLMARAHNAAPGRQRDLALSYARRASQLERTNPRRAEELVQAGLDELNRPASVA